ncbi:cysteine rich repeat-containing protein [Bradyrhizobium sp. BRP22]|uniref:cysteine rich repeat-containing protein n=1 Tax=Bradyrhizobium sp. BRP22 TaxID=2793821 RepID=UPI001CD3A276|nr:cysteine rich repeat-containing protein [Bradyrhizobium sp. BRP22]MCA1452901.1 cysteine rich repeat-containing protein [Bradyrhizobium sp. BRP22]
MSVSSTVFAPLRILSALALAATVTARTARAETLVPTQLRSETRSQMQACRGDYSRFCSNVSPGGGRIIACLQSHATELSSSCAQAVTRTQASKDAGSTAK